MNTAADFPSTSPELLVRPLSPKIRERLTAVIGEALRAQRKQQRMRDKAVAAEQAALRLHDKVERALFTLAKDRKSAAQMTFVWWSFESAMEREEERSRAEQDALRLGLEWREVFDVATRREPNPNRKK